MLSRRQLIQIGLLSSGYPFLSRKGRNALIPRSWWDAPSSPATTPWMDPLPIPPVARPSTAFGTDCSARPYSLNATAVPPGGVAAWERRTRVSPSGARDPQHSTPDGAKYYRLIEEEADVQLHADYPTTRVWRMRDSNTHPDDAGTGPGGPTIKVRMNQAQRIRVFNQLPSDHMGFGTPYSTMHLHGGHQPTHFDGFPEETADYNPVFGPGEYYDYCFDMKDVGWSTGQADPSERPSTLWYHDHLLDNTGPNVYRGLFGLYIVHDELDTGNELTGLHLPSGEFDVPLVLADRLIAPDGSLCYLPGTFNGFLGDKVLVNGKIEPYLEVRRRKYRFRLLNGSNARYYKLYLSDGTNDHQVTQIATDGGLMTSPLSRDWVFMAMGERKEIVIDFSQFPEGTELYLEDRVNQVSAVGPGGSITNPAESGVPRPLIKFVVGAAAFDVSQVPSTLRPMDPIPQSEIDAAVRRTLTFVRQNGSWVINLQTVDIDNPMFSVACNSPEIWRLENLHGWWHPIHVHLEFGRVLNRWENAGASEIGPLPDEDHNRARRDIIPLASQDHVEVFFKFRDHLGPFMFHCHNLEHEDHFMMARFDVV